MFKLILIAWFHEVLDKFLDILLCNCNKQLEIWNVLEEGEGGGGGKFILTLIVDANYKVR